MQKKFLGIVIFIILVSGISFASDKNDDQKVGKVFYKKIGESYIVHYIDRNGKEKYNAKYPREPVIIDHGNYLIEIRISTGNPLWYSEFIDLKKEVISTKAFEYVLAVNAKKYIILVAGEDALYLYNIFKPEKEIMKIGRDFSETATLATVVQEAKFIEPDELYISYLTGKDYIEKSETIKIPEN
jgi:hypothetical protein